MYVRLFLVSLLCANSAFAHEKLAIQSMEELRTLEATLGGPRQETLFVFDIDNTVLRTKQALGSDAWYTWQENLLKANPADEALVAATLEGLLTIQGWLFQIGEMIAPEVGTPRLVGDLQEAGHPVILLTSRGADLENLTQRELTRNGYDIEAGAISPRRGYASAFLPYDIQSPEKSCLSAEDVQRLGLAAARPVIYRKGVMMTSGQNKGAMLRTLLCKLRKTYSAIVFIDDHQRHVDRVFLAYENQPGDVRSVKYNFLEGEVQAFHASDKSQVRGEWQRLKAVVGDIFKN